MEKRQRIFILGNSLILNALGESLNRSGQFDLTNLELPNDFKDLEPMPNLKLQSLQAMVAEQRLTLTSKKIRPQ